jgi:hypothetical protein
MIRLASLFLGAFCVGSCAASDGPETYPALSETRTAQAAFRVIQRRWFEEDEPRRPLLRSSIQRFLVRHPTDPRAANVRILLAWICILEGKQSEARRMLTEARASAAPSVRDFADVAEARLLLARQQPAAALAKLEPLAGKLVDPDERLIYSELRLQAALASGRFRDAVRALSGYLAAAPGDLGDRARLRAESAVKSLPDSALESSLQDLDAKARLASLSPPEVWLRRVVRERLIRRAVENKDAKLARRLLDSHPGLARRDDLSAQLMELAASASAAAYSESGFVGLALEVGDPDSERRSASVARGLSQALAAWLPGAGSMPLVVKTADAHGVGATLSELSRAGALAVVAGVSDVSAEQAATWAVSVRTPVLLMRDTRDLVLSDFSFVLGISDMDQLDALQKELSRRGVVRAVRVGSGGTNCRADPEKAGAARFPVTTWKQDGVEALSVLASRSCVLGLFTELRAMRFEPWLALGLEGAEQLPFVGKRSLSLSAGSFPAASESGEPADFYQALGADAGSLLRAAWEQLGGSALRAQTASRAALLANALAGVSATLRTSEATGFAGKRRLARRLTIREAP